MPSKRPIPKIIALSLNNMGSGLAISAAMSINLRNLRSTPEGFSQTASMADQMHVYDRFYSQNPENSNSYLHVVLSST